MTARPLLTVDTSNPTPPYEQLRRQLAELIQSAALAPGDRLPPLRQLAADLGLAVGTVARAYRELESAGLISSRRGGGTRVSATAPSLSDSERHSSSTTTPGPSSSKPPCWALTTSKSSMQFHKPSQPDSPAGTHIRSSATRAYQDLPGGPGGPFKWLAEGRTASSSVVA